VTCRADTLPPAHKSQQVPKAAQHREKEGLITVNCFEQQLDSQGKGSSPRTGGSLSAAAPWTVQEVALVPVLAILFDILY